MKMERYKYTLLVAIFLMGGSLVVAQEVLTLDKADTLAEGYEQRFIGDFLVYFIRFHILAFYGFRWLLCLSCAMLTGWYIS